MAKYNLTPKKEKVARYQTLLSDKLKDCLYEGILRIIVAEGKYKDKTYNTRKLAADLNTNARYISAVCATRLHKNYSEFVNDFRINEAMSLLSDRRFDLCRMVCIAKWQASIPVRVFMPTSTIAWE